tara:strand:+ start:974 stop:1765 length:792 start_codon:yes stop_codon:yes gene_type:complete
MTSAKQRRRKLSRRGPSAPRVIGANDNIGSANDNETVELRGVVLNKKQARDLDQAEARLASPDLGSRRQGAAQMARVLAEVDEELDRRRRLTDEGEIKALALARGDRVIEPKDIGSLQVSRDGLDTMRSAGAIGSVEYAAAMMYRADYERLDPESGLTPPSPDASRSISHGGDGWAVKRREIADRIRSVHLMIAGVDRGPGETAAMPALPAGHPVMRAIFALEEVAGKGSNLRDLTSSGSGRARLSKSLILALGCCAIVYGLD